MCLSPLQKYLLVGVVGFSFFLKPSLSRSENAADLELKKLFETYWQQVALAKEEAANRLRVLREVLLSYLPRMQVI